MAHRFTAVVATAGLIAMLAGVSAAQDRRADATLTLSQGSVAAGIGFSWGSGTLTYKGKAYPVKVQGVAVGEVGVSRATATGSVFDLKKLEDFAGNYTAAGAGIAAGGGAGISALRNQNGVVIELKSTTQGASLKLATEGVKLTLEK